jgi:hypothetical protein
LDTTLLRYGGSDLRTEDPIYKLSTTPTFLSIFFSDPSSDYKYSDIGSGATGYISSEDVFLNFFDKELQDKTLRLFVPNSKRLGGYTQWVHFSEKCTPLEDLKKRFMVSLKKALGRCLFLLGDLKEQGEASKV